MKEYVLPKPQRILARNVKPEEIAKQYLKCEFRKIFKDINDKKVWRRLDRIIDKLDKKLNGDFWKLVAGISEGFRLKWVFRVLSNTAYSWQKEIRKLEDFTMTGMSTSLNKAISKSGKKFQNFIEYWNTHPRFAKRERDLIKPRPLRDKFPILVYQQKDKLKIFDGMRRSIAKAIGGEKLITAYVGYITNPRGKMAVNSDKIYFLTLLLKESTRKNKNFKKALITIGKEINRQYRNGRKAYKERMRPLTENKDVKEIINKILVK